MSTVLRSERNCWLCDSRGYWEDPRNEQTIPCHICRPWAVPQIKHTQWDSFWPELKCKYHGGRLPVAPWLLVVHSGAKAANVAEFFHTQGSITKPGRQPVLVSAHVNWSATHNAFTQGVALDTVAYHCGGSLFNGKGRLNYCSIGIELPGPAAAKHRADAVLDATYATIIKLLELCPELNVAVRHSDIDPRKADPGPGFQWGPLLNTRLSFPFETVVNT